MHFPEFSYKKLGSANFFLANFMSLKYPKKDTYEVN